MRCTKVFNMNLSAYNQGKRIIVNKGSTRSSKTYSLLQLLYIIAELSSKARIISVVSESVPHLKKGCMRDFKTLLQNENKWSDSNWNATNSIYKVNNSMIEFFSVDSPGKVHGPARDILYINECINIEYETYRQLAIRTTETIFLDCNPCFRFWLDDKVLVREESILIHSTYKDNDYLTAAQVQEIESNQGDANWWQVYGLGLTGSLVGSIMVNWDTVPQMPTDYKYRWIGLDFGFTNDPTAIVDVRLSEGELWIDELLYEKRYDNMMIADLLEEKGIDNSICIVADSAEPKSIAEIRSRGFKIEAAQKGKDSILNGIQILNRYKKNVTQNSLNIINEYRNYKWLVDEFGEATNIAIDKYNHSIDAQRYVCLNKLREKGSFSWSVIGNN